MQGETASGTALLVVDMQNGFCDPAGSFARMGVDVAPFAAVVEPCRRLLKAARAADCTIVFFRYVYQPGYLDHGTLFRNLVGDMKREQAIVAGTWDAQIVQPLAPQPADLVIDKNRPSGFFANDLAERLRSRHVSRVVICGVTTSCCVESTARDAGQFDFETYVVEDATAEMAEDRHRAALNTLGFLFGDILTVQDVESRLTRSWRHH